MPLQVRNIGLSWQKGRFEMSTLTIRLPNDQHERLKALASARGTSLNKLFEEFSAKALAEFDTETRFRLRAGRGSRERGLEILDQLDRAPKG
ncbi:toxin-antitoxin system HicB family antitoxin [Pararhizobium sp. BT-229]|uniref:toxin-antitoxin system HicB family antitoxin n=1 Tax=Pararhizobium sp. BT-229 TaxID=2986923 RepID=UPI0021F76FDE|nr:toxin-antitoxin system HicB family antitoxin [Pararhizobium sp. BT-229]MCV9962391.1 toxin-antitoxin system HicB family antitoxin [Pararhizobium sp. BT-229]